MTIRAAIRSMRLRTLPLSLSGVVAGAMLAEAHGADVWWLTVALLLLTTIALQIISNLSNELGDYLQGTDDSLRQGPAYSMQQGELSEAEMRRMIRVAVVVCCVVGAAMVWSMYGSAWGIEAYALLALGAAAIWAAVHYTLGHHPYGYHGWGDLFVFIFFGLVSTAGGYYVVSQTVPPVSVWMVAAAVGCFSVGVLNINNLRDMATDAATRTTVPLLLGEHRAKVYHTVLIAAGWLFLLLFLVFSQNDYMLIRYLFAVMIFVYIEHVVQVWHRTGRALDPMLPMLVISTFITMLLLGLGALIHH